MLFVFTGIFHGLSIAAIPYTYLLQKLFVLLLHFPAMMFYKPCYPSLFLCGWDHYYIDAIDQINKSPLVDTKYVLFQSYINDYTCTSCV